MELFSHSNSNAVHNPLAEKLRPVNLENLVGQEGILRDGLWLKESLKKDSLPSLILWGPPGTGKTTFAKIIAQNTKKEFISLNAVSTGAKEIREYCEKAKMNFRMYSTGTVLFIDEIHRLNKSQQDVLLPYVESGDVVLIGATTENPSFEINSALLSRSRVIVFNKLTPDALRTILEKALDFYSIKFNEILTLEACDYLIGIADGDARRLLNRFEELQLLFEQKKQEVSFPISSEDLKVQLGSLHLYHDKKGEAHYDTISVFIKCIRGSDPDAALYYLARLIEAAEDPIFIARRLVILASEDIGNADPRALEIAVNGFRAVEIIGLPECGINLAQVVVYLACAPKSNSSYMGYKKALEMVKKTGTLEIPLAVRNAPTKLMKELGYSQGYNYAHEGQRGWAEQEFLPEKIKDSKFYESKQIGYEKRMQEFLDWMKKNVDKGRA